MRYFRNLCLGLMLAIVVLWPVFYGAHGYVLGSPPSGLGAIGNCYQTTRVDFMVPMYRQVSAVDCEGLASQPAQSSSESQTTPASPPPICDDPNAPADGNTSGERSCP